MPEKRQDLFDHHFAVSFDRQNQALRTFLGDVVCDERDFIFDIGFLTILSP